MLIFGKLIVTFVFFAGYSAFVDVTIFSVYGCLVIHSKWAALLAIKLILRELVS